MEEDLMFNANVVRTMMRDQLGVSLNFDEAGVRWLDGFIERQRAGVDEHTMRKLVATLGSYFGECIRQTYGGRWEFDVEHKAWRITFSEGNAVFPINKVHKQILNGADDSVLGMFSIIPSMLQLKPIESVRVRPRRPPPPPKPWWKFWS